MANRDQSPFSGGDFNEWEIIKKCRRFQELFHGRFTNPETGLLLKHNDWDLERALGFTLSSEPDEIRAVIKEAAKEDLGGIGLFRQQRREQILADVNVRQLATQNKITNQVRQFACGGCKYPWWRRVPVRKLVSRCRKCKTSYDPIPRDSEWGWAKFVCECGNEFHGFGAMGKTPSPCYECHEACMPTEIIPPYKGRRREGRSRRTRHSCSAPNCFNRCPPGPNEPFLNVLVCVHPKSLKGKLLEQSKKHDSSGSTVKTFLTQADLEDISGDYEPSLADIDEYLGGGDNQ